MSAASGMPDAPADPERGGAAGQGGGATVLAVWKLRRAVVEAGLHPAVHATAGRTLDRVEQDLIGTRADRAAAAGRLRELAGMLARTGGDNGDELVSDVCVLASRLSLTAGG